MLLCLCYFVLERSVEVWAIYPKTWLTVNWAYDNQQNSQLLRQDDMITITDATQALYETIG